MEYTRRRITMWLAGATCGYLLSRPVQWAGASPSECLEAFLLPQDRESAEDQIRRVVIDSQFNETLIIYVYPSSFDKRLLTKYWVSEAKGGQEIAKVENSVRRLLDKRWHYSKESANEQFDIRSIQVFPPGDVAEVRTYERWYCPMVDEEGRLVKDRDSILEFPAVYRVIKMDGRWLIQKSSVPRRERG